MVRVRPFAALRPPKELVQEVSARPYDVMNTQEAAAEAGEKSLLHITRPEIDFTPFADEAEDRAYRRAADNFCTWQERGYLVREDKPCYYVYAQIMGEHIQYGMVLCAHTDDYFSGAIKKHELTRRDKEDGRMKHILIQSANIEPVFFSYPDNPVISDLVKRVTAAQPEYDFVSPGDGFGHKMWVVSDPGDIKTITDTFATIPAMYIADGHHRTAAAARVGREKAQKNPNHSGDEEYNFFMAVCFPDSQLKVMDYNRVVKDLNGMTADQLLKALEADFEVREESGMYRPSRLHEFSMYLEGKWYSLAAKPGRWSEEDPIENLDVTVLSRLVLDKLLGIKDLRTDKRIDFVGGLRGLGELERRVNSGEMAVAFALYPVTMGQIIAIADKGEIMPPKTTWFEPKLRSGLTIHTFFEEE